MICECTKCGYPEVVALFSITWVCKECGKKQSTVSTKVPDKYQSKELK